MKEAFSKIEKIILLIFFIMSLGVFIYSSGVNYYASQLDSAMMVDNIESTFLDGRPVSQLNSSALKAISTVIVQMSDVVCAEDLREDRVDTVEMLTRHAYFFLYALAPLNLYFSALDIAASFQSVAFIGLLLAAYLYIRSEKLPIAAALLFCAFIVVHPAWSLSAFGQFYPDRLFILVGALYIWLLHRSLVQGKGLTWSLLLAAIVAAALTERAAIMIGISTLGVLVLYLGRGGWRQRHISLIGLAIAILVYGLLYMKLVQNNSDYASFTNAALSFLDSIKENERFRLGLQKFVWVNLPYLVLALFEWRMALIVLGAMLPNMIGSIGGAEKTGWSTHYHSMYFPFLIVAASMGFVRLYRLLGQGLKIAVPYLIQGLVVLYMAVLSPYSLVQFWEINSDNLRHNAIIKAISIFSNTGDGYSVRISANLNRDAAGVIPAGVSVSAPEGLMPALVGKDRVLHYYPLGIGSADYVIVNFRRNDNESLYLSGANTYLGDANRVQLDACLGARVSKDFQLVKTFSPGAATHYGLAVFKRKVS